MLAGEKFYFSAHARYSLEMAYLKAEHFIEVQLPEGIICQANLHTMTGTIMDMSCQLERIVKDRKLEFYLFKISNEDIRPFPQAIYDKLRESKSFYFTLDDVMFRVDFIKFSFKTPSREYKIIKAPRCVKCCERMGASTQQLVNCSEQCIYCKICYKSLMAQDGMCVKCLKPLQQVYYETESAGTHTIEGLDPYTSLQGQQIAQRTCKNDNTSYTVNHFDLSCPNSCMCNNCILLLYHNNKLISCPFCQFPIIKFTWSPENPFKQCNLCELVKPIDDFIGGCLRMCICNTCCAEYVNQHKVNCPACGLSIMEQRI